MPQNQFSGTGIVDGQIVEANQVSQSVDAFTGAKDYRITLTGSMELSGSFFMSGSFINEYTGQFSTLGLGVAAPTAPTMLYIKDTSAGGDPAIIMEATTGNDSARIRLKNPDVEYDLGAFGSSGDDFMVIQDTTSSPKFPFIIGKGTNSYTLYTSDDSVGIGLGQLTSVTLGPLDAGSLQAAGRVSGSSMRADIISASAAGENIHGTASYATYIETAVTASYVKAENIDFYYSISQQVNSGGRIAAVTGSYGYLQLDADSGLSIGNQASLNYTKIISGSGGGDLYLGSVEEGNFIKMTGIGNTIELDSGDKVYLKDNVVTPGTITISGSLSGDRKLVVGPNNTAGTINARSSSLLVNSLEFNENSEPSLVGNLNTSSTSRLYLSAGGGATNYALTVSASRDIEVFGQMTFTGNNDYQAGLLNKSPYLRLGPKNAYSNQEMDDVTYRGGNFATVNTNNYVLWELDATGISGNAEPFRVKVNILGFTDSGTQYRAVAVEMDYLCTFIFGNDPGFALSEVSKTVRQSSYNNTTSVASSTTQLVAYGQNDSLLKLTLDSTTSQIVTYRWQIQIIRLNSEAAL